MKEFISSDSLYIPEVGAGTQARQDLEAGTGTEAVRDVAYAPPPCGLLSMISYSDRTTSTKAAPLTLIISKENGL